MSNITKTIKFRPVDKSTLKLLDNTYKDTACPWATYSRLMSAAPMAAVLGLITKANMRRSK